MSIVLRYNGKVLPVFSRAISSSCTLCLKQWRVDRGLPINRNAEGVLTDGPDFAYLDGRPTPMLNKQKLRMQRQRDYASKMVEIIADLKFAKDRHRQIQVDKQRKTEQIIANRLKPKGSALIQRKK